MGMSMAIRRILFTAVPLALVACEPPPEEAPPPPPPMSEAGATAMRNAYVDAYMRKNAAGAAVFYADDAVLHNADGEVHIGQAAIEAAFTAMMEAGMDSLGLVSQSFEASGDLATDQGTFIRRTLDPQTKEATRVSGNYKIVIAREADGSFKFVQDSVWATGDPQ
jgi:ketosteroid isomerase-like protein